ncbi:hypothetical protein PAXRUDRAFT_19473 [Paxillus rubicundulus Ve08.2h10]|uniref:Uncharacterized protein n=2 Tax=Paxillus rubicundulus Ve08.2h10 TaxID=930991 RepID=A0A0D0DC66_9AGAM|nr:hypothetical protein PAXRUDRAFT_19473 [Paxillus rubicundulus Ve08.2h10]
MSDTLSFVQALKNASTTDPVAKLSDEALDRLHNPPTTPLVIDSHASYERVYCSCKLNFAGAPGAEDIISYHNVKRLIRTHTGIELILHDMCPKTSHAFTGPYSTLDKCYICQTSQWNEEKLQGSNGRIKVPAQQFTTIPVGPQLQACSRSPESAHEMRYLWEHTQKVLDDLQQLNGDILVVDDIVMGWDYLSAVLDGDIKEHNIVLMVSLDGAQLYDSKESDCWIYIWVILNISPAKRYHKLHVLPGGFIPGPNKPKNVDSFLFPGMHHLTALQCEGLPMWDPLTDLRYISNIYLIFTTADGPGLIYWDSMVGHSGKNGCRVYCGVIRHRKDRSTHYYPAPLHPHDHIVAGSDNRHINVFKLPQGGSHEYADNLRRIVSVHNQTQWDKMKTETGLTKPPLILGLNPALLSRSSPVHDDGHHASCRKSLGPSYFPLACWDWAVLMDNNTWKTHGEAVAAAGSHLPGSYDRKPRNIAEKLNTQYKTWEFQLYTFGLAPILLYGILPTQYWVNYCMLVHGFQIMCQHSLAQQQLQDAHVLLCSWELDFECKYYQRKHDRQEIRQPSKPYANLAREGVQWCQVNALISALPELDEPAKGLPYGTIDLKGGYALLHKRAKCSTLPDALVAQAIRNYLPHCEELPRITKWARLLLPNGQIARLAWREMLKPPEQLRISHNVKFILGEKVRVGEVQYFTQLATPALPGQPAEWHFHNVAILKLYSELNTELLHLSSQVLAASTLLNKVVISDVKAIQSIVAMIPKKLILPASEVEQDCFCMMERPGLNISDLGVPYSIYSEDDDDEPKGNDIE